MTNGLNLNLFSRTRVKLIRQTEISECGLACIAMVANYHGFKIDLGSIRRRFATSLRGTSLKTLMAMSDRIGLAPRPVKLPIEELMNLRMPAILHWDLNHFVVLEKVSGDKALVHNPASASKWIDKNLLSKHFTGVALELLPTDDFKPGEETKRLKLAQLWKNMVGLKRAIIQILILSILLQIFALASPYYMQLAIDRVLPAQDYDLLFVLSAGFGLMMLIGIITGLLRSLVLLWAGTSLGFGLATNIARRLFRLPIEWFERRHVGDILSRFGSLAPIQGFLLTGGIAVLIDGVMAILTLTVMFFFSAKLAIIAVVAFILYLIVRLISFAFERDAIEETIVTGAAEQSILMETIRGMTTLRLFNRETLRHALWQSKLTDSVNADVRLAKIGLWQGLANSLLFGIEGIVTVYLAISFVIEGGFSVGMIFAYMSYKGQFTGKATSLVNQFISFRMLGLHLERLSDIALTEEDISFGASQEAETNLHGKIELRDIIYRYSLNDPIVLNGVNLIVEPGDHIAITGPSGGGKSTLVKILLGLAEPINGEMLIDGIPLSRFGHKSYHDQIAGVLQEDALFAGSLADNIALFDDNPDMELIIASAQAASIHNDIMAMGMQYETLVGDMGSALSGGQKQRILLARALYRKPKILIMDEGTAHLDAVHEALVNKSISQMGITRIIIAHRQETIASARLRYVMDGGILQQID